MFFCSELSRRSRSWPNTWVKMSHTCKDLTAMTTMEEFLVRYRNPTQAVATILENESRQIMETNQKVIESLLKVVMLCGKQGLALRGHHDDTINWEEEGSLNEGIFVQLVRFRAETCNPCQSSCKLSSKCPLHVKNYSK